MYFALDRGPLETHDILCEGACLVAKDVLDLPQVRNDAAAGLGGRVAFSMMHLYVVVDEVQVRVRTHFHRHVHADRDCMHGNLSRAMMSTDRENKRKERRHIRKSRLFCNRSYVPKINEEDN